MGDLATWYLALGALVLVAIAGANRRVPVLALALLQNLLHAFNHLLDLGEADPAWLRQATLDLARGLERAPCVDRSTTREAGAMRVLVAGASGAIGRSLVPRARAAGTRRPPRRERSGRARNDPGGGCTRGDVRRARRRRASRAASTPRLEVVAHELTALPTRLDPRDKRAYEATNRIRRDRTRQPAFPLRRAVGATTVPTSRSRTRRGHARQVKAEDRPAVPRLRHRHSATGCA